MISKHRISVTLNGQTRSAEIDGRQLLVELVREPLRCMGTRVGCLTGDCGACTVLLDGKVTKSCLVLAVSAKGRNIQTIEGLENAQAVQTAFVRHNGFQCGYCTTGMVMVAVDLLRHDPKPDRGAIRKAISGNLCRCTGYENIVEAIHAAAHDPDFNPPTGHQSQGHFPDVGCQPD
jgi:aerobic-type carbon monoxide dehydrogenase small subunit (CoxS/CutS family)